MVRRMWGIGLMVLALAAFGLLPGRVQGAEFDVSHNKSSIVSWDGSYIAPSTAAEPTCT